MTPPAAFRRRPYARIARAVALAAPLLAAACQSSPAAHSGFLSTYAGLGDPVRDLPGPDERRDDALSDGISRVYIEASVLQLEGDTTLKPEDLAMVRNEVDRQICYEVSERFDLAPTPEPDAGLIRTAIVRVRPTNRAGSVVSAATGFFIPVPILKVRVPMTTGGLAVESELLTPDGRQAAAIAWSRTVEIVDQLDPSLSSVGDALQLAEPLGDAVGDAFSSDAREVRPIPESDPCARYGPRRSIGRFVGGRLVGAATGLYVPSIEGAGRPADAPESEGTDVRPQP